MSLLSVDFLLHIQTLQRLGEGRIHHSSIAFIIFNTRRRSFASAFLIRLFVAFSFSCSVGPLFFILPSHGTHCQRQVSKKIISKLHRLTSSIALARTIPSTVFALSRCSCHRDLSRSSSPPASFVAALAALRAPT
jgi:hypothetical protein